MDTSGHHLRIGDFGAAARMRTSSTIQGAQKNNVRFLQKKKTVLIGKKGQINKMYISKKETITFIICLAGYIKQNKKYI